MTQDLAMTIVQHLEDDTWTKATRRDLVEAYTEMAVRDAEGLARRSRGEAEPQTAADRAGKRQAWLDKVEATRRSAMQLWGGSNEAGTEPKPNHAAAVRCLQLEGQAEGWLGAERGKAAPQDPVRTEVDEWREALRLCPRELLEEALRGGKEMH